MKIVFLQDDFPPQSMGGAGFSTYELARGMRKVGHEVYVITTCRDRKKEGEYIHEGITVFSILSNYAPRWRAWLSLYNPPMVQKLARLLRQLQPDVVHINNVHQHLSYHSFKLARKYGRAVIFTARDTMTVYNAKLDTPRYLKSFDARVTWFDRMRVGKKRYNPLYTFLTRRYLRYADKRYSVSEALRNALSANGIQDVEVIHTGLSVHDWQVADREKDDFKNRFSLYQKKVVLFAGRVSAGKGGEQMVAAFEVIAREIPDAVLLIVGTEDESLRRLKANMDSNSASRIVVTGWLDRDTVRVAYGVADVVIVPSLYLDPFPRTVIEAMASERPVVGTCYGGAPEIIVDGVTGYIVNPLHSKEIALKTIDLLKDSKKAEQFGRAGYERIKNSFNLEDKVNEYIVVYESLIRREH